MVQILGVLPCLIIFLGVVALIVVYTHLVPLRARDGAPQG